MPDHDAPSEILFEQRGPIGIVTLNRPDRLNALSTGMVTAMRGKLEQWGLDRSVAAVVVRGAGEKAFCAGGDIRAAAGDGAAFAAFLREEYKLNRAIKRFNKPYIALMDGVCMGGGVGVSIHGDYRVGGDKLLLAMPELAIGLVTDVGASFFLPRLPHNLGMYLGLTGARLKTPDCMNAHLIDYYVRSERTETLVEQLIAADYSEGADEMVCELLAMNASAPEAPPLKQRLAEIDAAFGHDSLEAVLAALDAGSEWSREQAAVIWRGCPVSAKLVFQMLRSPAEDIEAALSQEFRAMAFCSARPDFKEGVTAALIEKRPPQWSPASLAEVTEADLKGAFDAPAGGDLAF